MGPSAHARRLERRLGSSGCGAHRSHGAWHGRRRLLAHPGLLLRPVWAKADAWAQPQGPIQGESWHGFSVGHAITRSVRDSAALLDATTGSDVGAPYDISGPTKPFLSELGTAPGKLRIAFTMAPFRAKSIHDACVQGLKSTLKLLSALGHEIVEATLPFDKEQWLLAFMTILAGETQSDIRSASALAGRPLGFKDFEASTYSAGLLGSAWSAADYASAAKYLQTWSRRVGDVFTRYDVLLTPTLAEPPPLIGALKPSSAELTIMNVIGPLKAGWFLKVTGLAKMLSEKSLEFIPYTPLFNVTGQPAMSVPLHWNGAGLWDAVCDAVWRRSDPVPPGRPTRAGAALVREGASGLLICNERGQLTGLGVSASSAKGEFALTAAGTLLLCAISRHSTASRRLTDFDQSGNYNSSKARAPRGEEPSCPRWR